MKIIITESQLKDFIRKQFNVDLSNKIQIVTNKWELPMELDRIITTDMLNRYLNHYGPMFVITTRKNMYLVQNRGKDGWMIVNQNDYQVSDLDIMKELGIESLGLSVGDLIDEYFQESINESKDNYDKKWKDFDLYMRRRYNIIKDMVEKTIDNTMVEEPWEDEFEYADSIISRTTDDLIFGTPQFNINGDDEDYDWIHYYIKDNFGAKIFDHYYDNK
jgi:hypothetical protein